MPVKARKYMCQAVGSTQSYGSVEVRNDPGLCQLIQHPTEGWLAEQDLMETSDLSPDQTRELRLQRDREPQAKRVQ